MVIGANCVIGHKVMLHGCMVGDNSLIGMGATLLNGSKIGNNSRRPRANPVGDGEGWGRDRTRVAPMLQRVDAAAVETAGRVSPSETQVLGLPWA
jgi:tetrahydrodipicolinate N-succinyltransferase